MGWALYQLGSRYPPKTARRRLYWTIGTALFAGLLGAGFSYGAIASWVAIAEAHGERVPPLAVPSVLDALVLSAMAVGLWGAVVFSIVMGSQRVREQRAAELAAEREAAVIDERLRAARARLTGAADPATIPPRPRRPRRASNR